MLTEASLRYHHHVTIYRIIRADVRVELSAGYHEHFDTEVWGRDFYTRVCLNKSQASASIEGPNGPQLGDSFQNDSDFFLFNPNSNPQNTIFQENLTQRMKIEAAIAGAHPGHCPLFSARCTRPAPLMINHENVSLPCLVMCW